VGTQLKMKIIGVEISQVKLNKFYPREDKIELEISYNNGQDRKAAITVETLNEKNSAEEILEHIRRCERASNQKNEDIEAVMGEMINIVIKNEESVFEEISKFIKKARERVEKIKGKRDAVGYLDLIRDIKSLVIQFNNP
jgi:hypothetical protein